MCQKQLRLGYLLLFGAMCVESSGSIASAQITLTCPANSGQAAIPYASSLAAKGGVPPYTISITKGALPAGLTLNAATGAITGTPTAAGKATFTAKVVDSLVAGAGGAPGSTTAECAIDVEAPPPCTVASVALVAKDSPLDANPNAGGGRRIFAEKKTAAGALLNVVDVTATINPVAKGKAVYFKSFDVDDPSSDDAPIDPNGKKGDDNRGMPRAGRLSAASAVTDDKGNATLQFTTTKQPGDNFKVAASCSQKYLAAVTLKDDDGSVIQDIARAPLPTANGKLTEMLTVWRRAHVEVDAMKASARNFYTGKITAAVSFLGVRFVVTDLAAMEPGRLGNGRLVIGANSYAISSNSASVIFTTTAVPATEVGKEFTAYDDDDFNGNDGANKKGDTGEPLVAPDQSLVQDSDDRAKNLLAPAYVRPTYDLANADPAPPFAVNQAGDDGADVRALFKFDNRARNTNDYWVIYLLGAYQPITTEDQDPDTEVDRATYGRVDAVTSGGAVGQGAVTYLELVSAHELAVLDKWADTLMDPFCKANIANFKASYRNAPVTAHEVGHLFGGTHTDGGLMSDRCARVTLTFSDTTIATARSIARP